MTPPPAEDWQLEAEPPPGVPEPPPEPPPPRASARRAPAGEESPPPPERIAEAMLFAGGRPLTPEAFARAVRVPPESLPAAVEVLNRTYKSQRRPYAIQPRDDGFVLAVLPAYRGLREKLHGGPREARLSPPALDVLSLVAYRQPVGKAEIDALRGADSGGVLRQLVRLGLVAARRGGPGGDGYTTTPRFLEVFGLGSLDDLPRLGDAEAV